MAFWTRHTAASFLIIKKHVFLQAVESILGFTTSIYSSFCCFDSHQLDISLSGLHDTVGAVCITLPWFQPLFSISIYCSLDVASNKGPCSCATTPPLTGVGRRMERKRQKLVGRDKDSLTEQQTKGTVTTTIPDQSDSFLQWHDWLGRWGESRGCCLPILQKGFWHCLPQHPHREAQEVWAGWVEGEVDWELAEWQNSEGCHQRHWV